MTQIVVRQAKSSDKDSIARISRNLGYNLHEEQQFNHGLEQILNSVRDELWIVEYEGRVCGWIHSYIVTPLASTAFMEIGGLVVDHEQQRKGLGTRLWQHVQQKAAEENLGLRVRCNYQRIGAIQFYRKLGLREIKRQCVFASY